MPHLCFRLSTSFGNFRQLVTTNHVSYLTCALSSEKVLGISDTSLPCVVPRVGHSVLLHSVRYVLLRSEKRTLRSCSFFSVLFLSFWRLMRPKRTLRSFLKNGKERKERFVLFKRTEKNVRTFCSFAKEREKVPFFFLDIYRNIYRYI